MKVLHVEASTFCNARCPLCPRSLYGLKVEGVYPEVHLKADKFKTVLENFPERGFVYFNGNLGDPMMNPDIAVLTGLTNCKTSVTTNGSIGSRDTWLTLAKEDVEVVFSIDGLHDTNHLYRQDVQWNKIMERVKWFIENGGNATWKFIIFKHNVHQRNQAEDLANSMGFKKFLVENHGRNYGPVLSKDGEITHWILPADGSKQPESSYDVKAGIERYKTTHKNFFPEEKVYNINCEHEQQSSVYIDARGRIGPCCYQGFDLPEQPFMSLSNFPEIKKTWSTKKCNMVCAMSCGS